jgi:hypothetical protein
MSMGKGESVAEFVTTKKSWYRSSYSGSKTECLEARCDNGVLVRDSRQPDRGVLAFSAPAWKELLAAVDRD